MHSNTVYILTVLLQILVHVPYYCQGVPVVKDIIEQTSTTPDTTVTKVLSDVDNLEIDSNAFVSKVKESQDLLDKYEAIEEYLQKIESGKDGEFMHEDLGWLQDIVKEFQPAEDKTNERVRRASLDLVDLEGTDVNVLPSPGDKRAGRRRQGKMNGGRRNGGRRKQVVPTRTVGNRRNNFETPLNRSMMLKYPYNNVVRVLSSQRSGCTGILLDNMHVLTAAHCVHNQTHFLPNCNVMRVLLPYLHGFKIMQISTIRVPYLWLRHSSPVERKRHRSYDYAIIKLEKTTRKRQFMPFGLENHKRASIADTLSYTWYPLSSGRFNQKLKTCRVQLSDFKRNGDELNVDCDSEVGSSGSAVILNTRRYGTRIIGVVSNKIINTGMDEISVITTPKLINICSMIAADYRVSDYNKLPDSCPKDSYDSSNYVSYQNPRAT
ncbi:uncharacterized protein LOC117101094 [Anneissia japonica]|uniref:uncharacterized protein LOC117101094 n=1 Tax=Anneissia japonica TaxID=1529436 RepID=UPI0014256A2D|nr:uncharacterized protein LOC117101094 [Anneissia japonica]